MLALTKAVSAAFRTAVSVPRTSALLPCVQQSCGYASHNPKTNALKSKEKGKLRRQRIAKTDKPAQAKRNPRVSKL
ncbi:hypothetical protein GGF40_000461 [Coemansia sp. RSA 1286]|nr:hypothetical protein GGF39_000230 [Coemansia sp. RSA 1721]KAJ2639933.1 hypothetical protein GGF40_000461 [Coemansia sp. RSA 1286]